MFRKKVLGEKAKAKDLIRWRGHEITRIEALSDAVFAFAITLLIVALEVPENYNELMASMRMFFPFAVCFTILMGIWQTQNRFFRRYGLNDNTITWLNAALLFMTLFFVYPLKFLFSGVFVGLFKVINLTQAQNLFYIYSAGFIIIYILFAMMYRHALKRRDELELTDQEAFETQSQIYSHLLIACGGVFSICCAMLGQGFIYFAGFAYMLIWPLTYMGDKIRMKAFKNRFAVVDQAEMNTPPETEEKKVS